MPVEFEMKFVLKDAEKLLNHFLEEDWIRIDQFYLKDGVRFRRMQQGEKVRHILTYKTKIVGRLLEIETAISQDDYEHAEQAKVRELHKIRVIHHDPHTALVWDIDFLLDENRQIYFAMAELEREEGDHSPVRIADILRPHVELAVPYEDSHVFTNHKLTDEAYAATVLERYRAGEFTQALQSPD